MEDSFSNHITACFWSLELQYIVRSVPIICVTVYEALIANIRFMYYIQKQLFKRLSRDGLFLNYTVDVAHVACLIMLEI